MTTSPELDICYNPFDRLVHLVPHDLQEPVRWIVSFQKLFRKKYDDQIPEQGAEYLEYAVSNARKLQNMIRALVDFSHVGSNTKHRFFVPFLMPVLPALKRALDWSLLRPSCRNTADPFGEILKSKREHASTLRFRSDLCSTPSAIF